jgi:membrane protein implicated in regulation of membrane protease activity
MIPFIIKPATEVTAEGVSRSFTSFDSLWEIVLLAVCSVLALYLVAIYLKREETSETAPARWFR